MVLNTTKGIRGPRCKLSASARDRLIIDNLPLVKHVLSRLAAHLPAHVDRDDLMGAGTVGLIDATRRFDPRRNVRFQSYALARIRGTMLDSLRGADWLPRSVRSELSRIAEAREKIEQEACRAPTPTEIHERVGLRESKAARLARASINSAFCSLEDLSHDSIEDAATNLRAVSDPATQPEGRAILEEDKERLAAAIQHLSRTERLVITLYYFERMRLREIARIMRVTDSRVCQLHRLALRKLERILAESKSGAPALTA